MVLKLRSLLSSFGMCARLQTIVALTDNIAYSFCSDVRKSGQIFCTIRCGLGDIGDQVHHRWLCYERIPGFLDSAH